MFVKLQPFMERALGKEEKTGDHDSTGRRAGRGDPGADRRDGCDYGAPGAGIGGLSEIVYKAERP